MAKLLWDQIGERYYETGVSKGVIYPYANGAYQAGAAWSGLTSVTENQSGAEPNPFYADDIKYLNIPSVEEYGATIEAYTYPAEYGECIGEKEIAPGVVITQQTHKPFGYCYRTVIGNDTEYNDYGYKLHIVYGAMAQPTEKAYATVNDSPEPMTMSWEITTTPVEVPGNKPTAHLEFNSTKINAEKLAALEAILYGTDDAEARLPLPAEIITLFAEEDIAG